MANLNKRIRILLVDDHPVVREGLRSVLNGMPNLQVVGEASNGIEALEEAETLRPDVILMDVSMPEMNGIEATTRLMRVLPESKVLALSMHDSRSYITELMRAGARGYLLKDSLHDVLVKAIETVHEGGIFFSPQAAATIASTFGTVRERTPVDLSAREIEVLRGIARGRTSKDISEALGVSQRTIETHRENLARKLGCSAPPQLTCYALQCGYISPEEVR